MNAPRTLSSSSRVCELMSSPVRCVSLDGLVGEARRVMQDARVHALPVVDAAGEIQGVIRASDLLGPSATEDRVGCVMQHEVPSVGPYSTLRQAAEVFRSTRAHHLVVVSCDRQVAGILSAFDLAVAFASLDRKHHNVPPAVLPLERRTGGRESAQLHAC